MVILMVDVSNARCSNKASRLVQMLSGAVEVRGAQNTVCADRNKKIAMFVRDDLIIQY